MQLNHIFKDGLVIIKKLLGLKMYWRRKYNSNVSNLGIDLINMNQWVKNKSSLTNRIKKIANLKIKLVTNNYQNKNLLFIIQL